MPDEINTQGQPTTPVPDQRTNSRVSRRGLLAKGAAVAVGGIGVAAIHATPAQASTGTMMYGTSNNAGNDQTELDSTTTFSTLAAYNDSLDERATAISAVAFGIGLYASGSSAPLHLSPHDSQGAPSSGSHAT